MGLTKFENIPHDDVREFGAYEMTEERIVAFAERFDPQPFHVDAEAAAESVFGGLIASGLHTMSVCQLLVTEHFYSDIANIGGLGIDDTRFLEPVRPGDVLSTRIEIAEKRPSGTRDDRGIVAVDQTMLNQRRDSVMSNTALTLVERA